MTTAAEPAPLLRIRDVARRLSISPSKVAYLALQGDLPSVVIGERSRRFRPEDLEAYIAGQSSRL